MPNLSIKYSNSKLIILVSDLDTYEKLLNAHPGAKSLKAKTKEIEVPANKISIQTLSDFVKSVPKLVVSYNHLPNYAPHISKMLAEYNIIKAPHSTHPMTRETAATPAATSTPSLVMKFCFFGAVLGAFLLDGTVCQAAVQGGILSGAAGLLLDEMDNQQTNSY